MAYEDDPHHRSLGPWAAGLSWDMEPHLAELRASLEDEDLARAERAALRLERTARSLRSFNEPDAHNARTFSVFEAIELAVFLTRAEVHRRATVVRHYGPVAAVTGVAPRLTRVFVELLRNAARAIPPGMPSANTVSIATRTGPAGEVIVDMADTGVGIEREDMPYVFDPFVTTRGSEPTPGLGLAAARDTIRAMNGDITVESIAGRGSRFSVSLPAAMRDEDAAPMLPGLFARETLPPRRVLAVARTPAEALGLARFLGEDETEIAYATEDEAVERLALGETFDLVLCEPTIGARLRAGMRNLAPDALSRIFLAGPRAQSSGVFRAAPAPLESGTVAQTG